MLTLLASGNPIDHVLRHLLDMHIGPFHLTNQMLMALVAGILMVVIFIPTFLTSKSGAPSGVRNFFESIMEFLRLEVIRPALKENTDRFVGFLWTLFFFILFCNLLGQIPIAEIYTLATGHETHVGGTATGTPTTTIALAILAFLFVHVSGVFQVFKSLINGTYGHHGHHEEHSSDGSHGHEAAHDIEHTRGDALAVDAPQHMDAIVNPTAHYADDKHADHHGHDNGHDHHGTKMNPVMALIACVPLYLWNFAPHPFKPGPGGNQIMWVADIFMWGMLLILELIGAVIKPFALMIRLFANMIAGHIVLAALVMLIPAGAWYIQAAIGVPVTALSLLLRFLELFVCFLQAYIFTFLTTLFLASAVAPEH